MSEIEELRAENERLTRWKSEATEVILGLQDLGRALELPLGERITGTAAAEAAKQLRSEVERLREAWQDEYGRARSAEAEVERLQESERIARESERTAWDVHAEHVERMNVMLLRARSLQAEAEDSETAATDRAESSEAALTSECEAHAGLRARLEALADEWGNRWDVPEPGRFDPSARHMRLAATDLRAAFAAEPAEATASRPPETSGAGSTAPVAVEEGGEQEAGEATTGLRFESWCDDCEETIETTSAAEVNAFNVKHDHEHPAPSGSDEQGNRPAIPDVNGVHDTKGGE